MTANRPGPRPPARIVGCGQSTRFLPRLNDTRPCDQPCATGGAPPAVRPGSDGVAVNLDRSHLKWMVAALVLATAAVMVYLGCPGRHCGSSPLGLFFGLSGTSLMAFAGLLPFKK